MANFGLDAIALGPAALKRPAGARLTIPSLQVWRIADGRIVERWGRRHVTEALLARLGR